jgi:DNA-binding NtrC family response regulator
LYQKADKKGPMAELPTQTLNQGQTQRPVAVDVRTESAEGHSSTAALVAGSLFIGTAANNDLVIVDSTASRQHLMLELMSGGVRVKDLGSRNGTWFLGTRLRDAMVPIEATLRIGRTLVHLVPREENPAGHGATNVVAVSEDMKRVLRAAKKVSRARMATLIVGEAGVGKSRVAKLIHEGDGVVTGPLVTVDCQGVSADMLYALLFGTEAKDGVAAQQGRLKMASGGTFVLKSVETLPDPLQTMLLRCLETRTVLLPGASAAVPCEFRMIATTSEDLEARVAQGLFRDTLYFRLAETRISIAPLRQRPEDFEPLVRLLESKYSTAISSEVLEGWRKQPWLGNIRELDNAVARVALGLEALSEPAAALPPSKDAHLATSEKAYLQKTLRQANGKVAEAAKAAGISRSQFYRLMQKFGLT